MRNKVLTALLSFVIAFGLWLYVITVISPGAEKTVQNIPVEVQGQGVLSDRGLCITNNPEKTLVDLDLAGNRIDLNKLNNSTVKILLDVSNISEPGVYQQPYTVDFLPGEIASDAITVQKRTPGTIKVVVETVKTEKIPVVVTMNSPDEGYITDEEPQHADYIWISGPERIVKKIKEARVNLDLTGQHERIDGYYEYKLFDKNDKTLSQDELSLLSDDQDEDANTFKIRIQLRVAQQATITVSAGIKAGGGATENDVQIRYIPEQITVSGNPSSIKPLLDGTHVLEDIELGKLTEDTTLRLKLNLPPGVVCDSGEEEIVVEISFGDLRTKELVISNFEIKGCSENMEAAINTKSIKVMFRGPKAEIDALKSSDVKAIVDFSNATVGDSTRAVTIEIVNKDKKLGVLGTYKVETTLKAKTSG